MELFNHIFSYVVLNLKGTLAHLICIYLPVVVREIWIKDRKDKEDSIEIFMFQKQTSGTYDIYITKLSEQ
jgi:hypothetical protein